MSWRLKQLNPKHVFPEQKQVHFRLRNRHSGLVMALAGDLDDIKMMRIQEMEENSELEQIWFYQNGSLHSKVSRAAVASSGLGVNNTNGLFLTNLCLQLLEEFCLGPSGSMVMAGSRVGLAAELDAQAHLWSLTSGGFLRYTPTHNLVLDIKGDHPSLKKASDYLAALFHLNTDLLLIGKTLFSELLITDTLWTKWWQRSNM